MTMENIIDRENIHAAVLAVERNKGAPGIDGLTTLQLRPLLSQHWLSIRGKLLTGEYRPSPIRQKLIPKDGGGERQLGIPTVLDRMVQQAVAQQLCLHFDPHFSRQSYGYRPYRSAHQAVRLARDFVREGKTWMIDLDISKFFDHVNHDILMTLIGKRVRDKPTLKLIGSFLRAPMMIDGKRHKRSEGTPQGGPLSPLLANIYLDPLDKELERRSLSFVRYADDCNIFVETEAEAVMIYEEITAWIEAKLRLKINRDKSGTGRPWERKFLGFTITESEAIVPAKKALEKFKDRVRELWNARQSKTSTQLRDQWKRYIRGWYGYFRLNEEERIFKKLDGWIRRHIRKCFWQRWHSPEGRLRHLRHLGVKKKLLSMSRSSRSPWRLAKCSAMQAGLSNKVLRKYGFLCLLDLPG
jgi:group II intron reverse transcriptase/maturase